MTVRQWWAVTAVGICTAGILVMYLVMLRGTPMP